MDKNRSYEKEMVSKVVDLDVLFKRSKEIKDEDLIEVKTKGLTREEIMDELLLDFERVRGILNEKSNNI